MTNINIVVTGCLGRMGKRVSCLVFQSNDLRLVGGIEQRGHPAIGSSFRDEIGIDERDALILDDLGLLIQDCDVVVDFTNPKASLEHIKVVSRHKKRIVVGTTGFTKEEMKEIEGIASQTPIILAPNMSIGMNLVFWLAGLVSEKLKEGYDVEIIEAHHHHKKDAPSGSAKRLAEIISGVFGWSLDSVGVYGRKGWTGERKREEIGVFSIRAGDIVGEHTVIFGGVGERIELTHRAHTRDAFAQGALRATRFIASAPPGLYDMKDVLGVGQ